MTKNTENLKKQEQKSIKGILEHRIGTVSDKRHLRIKPGFIFIKTS